MIGVDMIKLERVQHSMERFGEKFLERFLSAEEIALIRNHKNAAGFWAAKEAASKALGCGIGSECGFHDILLSKSPKGAPLIDFSPRVKDAFHIASTSLSITHDGDYAIAVVAVEKCSI